MWWVVGLLGFVLLGFVALLWQVKSLIDFNERRWQDEQRSKQNAESYPEVRSSVARR